MTSTLPFVRQQNAQLQVSLLGAPQILLGSTLVNPQLARKAQALFYYLVSEKRQHERSHLASLFWADMPDVQARKNLRNILPELHKYLGDWLTITPETVGFSKQANTWVDVDVLLHALNDGNSYQPPAALLEATLLYHGDFLDGFFVADAPFYETWLTTTRARYQRLTIDALYAATQRLLTTGDFTMGLKITQRLLEIDPYHEPAHRLRMQFLFLNGERIAALEYYDNLEKLLADELAVAPDAETQAIVKQIRTGQYQAERLAPAPLLAPALSGWPASTPVTSAPVHQHNLSHQLTTFIGRKQEVAEICHQLLQPDVRLLTLCGAGGVGKTRLALAVAWSLLNENQTPIGAPIGATSPAIPDGVWFVSLESVTNNSGGMERDLHDQLAIVVANALRIHLASHALPFDQLVEALRERCLLLILDNFEHLMAGRAFVLELLHKTAGIKVLITSRRALHLQAEVLRQVDGLSLPAVGQEERLSPAEVAQFEAVALFVDRASHSSPHIQLGADNQSDILHICRLVMGNSLAIELAAGLTKFYSCAQIHQRLATDYTVLATDFQDIPARHRFFKVVLDDSWGLLTSQEARVLAGCALIQNAFSAETASAVTDASPTELRALVAQSLLHEVRLNLFEFHPLVRQYALEQLQTMPEVERYYRQRHASYYAERFGFDADTILGSLATFQLVQSELDNLRSAVHWSAQHQQLSLLLKLVDSLGTLYIFQGLSNEGLSQCALVLQQIRPLLTQQPSEATIDFIASVLGVQGYFFFRLGRYAEAEASLVEALSLAQPLSHRALALAHYFTATLLMFTQGDAQRQQQHLLLAIDYAQQGALYYVQVLVQAHIGMYHAFQGEIQPALRAIEAGLKILYAHHLEMLEGQVLMNLTMAYSASGDWTLAETTARQALDVNRQQQSSLNIAYVYERLALCADIVGEYDQVMMWTNRVLAQGSVVPDRHIELNALLLLGRATARLGALAESENVLQRAAQLAGELRLPFAWTKAQVELGNVSLQRSDWLGARVRYVAVLEQDRANNAPFVAAAEAGLALLCLRLGKLDEALLHVETILPFLSGPAPETYYDILKAGLVCYQVLAARQDPSARLILACATEWLHNQAAVISDEQQRHKFLTQVPEHRQLLEIRYSGTL